MAADAPTPQAPAVDLDTAPTPDAPAVVGGTDPHDALGLLGELEQRLGQLKQWQADNDHEAKSVREQALAIAEREEAFNQQRQELEDARQALEGERVAAAAERETLEATRGELDALRGRLDTQKAEQAGRTGELDRSRAELDQRDRGLKEREEAFGTREAELNERAAALDAQQAELNRQSGELADWQQQLEARAAELDEQRDKLDAAKAEAEALRVELDGQAEALTDGHAALDRDRAALQDERKTVGRTQVELRLRSEAIEAQQASLDRARAELAEQAVAAGEQAEGGGAPTDEALAELRAQREQIDADRAELDAMLASLEAREAELAEREGGMDRAAAQAAMLAGDAVAPSGSGGPVHADVVDDDAEASPDDTAGPLALDTALREREEVLAKKEHTFREALRLSKDKVLAERKAVQERAAELEELSHHLADREAELQEAGSQVEARRAQLDREQARLDAERAELERLRSDFDHGSDAAETVAGYEPAPLAFDRDEAAAAVDHDELASDLAAREASFREKKQAFREKLERMKAELIEQRDALRRRAADLETRAAALDERESALDARQAELEGQAASLADRPGIDGLADAAGAEREAELAAKAEALELRAAELAEREARAAADDPDGAEQRRKIGELEAELAEGRKAGHQAAGLEKERRMLVEVRKFLETSEAAMVQKWATKTTATVVALGIVALVCAAGFSFAVGRQLASPLWEASLALSVAPAKMPDAEGPRLVADGQAEGAEAGDGADGAALEVAAPTGEAWVQQFEQTVLSEPVMLQALNVMDKAGLRLFTSPQALAVHLREHLTFAGDPSRVELQYTTTDAEHAVPTLDALGQAILSYQMTVDRKAGRPDTARVLQKAMRHPEPVRDQTVTYAAATFAGVLGVALLASLVLRLSLARSKRVLDEGDAPILRTLDQPATWSPVRAKGPA